jgi:hypothetical protein
VDEFSDIWIEQCEAARDIRDAWGPSELAGHAVDIWQRRRRNCALPRTFIEKFTPDWDWLVR